MLARTGNPAFGWSEARPGEVEYASMAERIMNTASASINTSRPNALTFMDRRLLPFAPASAALGPDLVAGAAASARPVPVAVGWRDASPCSGSCPSAPASSTSEACTSGAGLKVRKPVVSRRAIPTPDHMLLWLVGACSCACVCVCVCACVRVCVCEVVIS